MRRQLPSVRQVVAEVKSVVQQSQRVKEASVPTPTFEIPLAQNLYKLATTLRNHDFTTVTYDDVFALSKALLEK